ncbi:hypothetical protein G5S34_13155 [Herbaspirillum frisingense]|uniref:hypothetical protein n=1 Tax=Herbaspirillum frisingense TaxID=92645 RepID=UPI001602CE09|nr:hypothetical protein [Herbaspirillum frisingense]QNB07619.1 hypothetical protein G5S34_13155 [Herbaspirillum frisingense]
MVFQGIHKMRLAWLFLSALACSSLQAAPVPMDQNGFTEYMVAKMRPEAGETPVQIKEPLALTVGSLQVNLGRLYAFCQQSVLNCDAEASNFAKAMADALKVANAPIDKDAVRLVIRPTDYVQSVELASAKAGSPTHLQYRPLVEGLVALAVLDTPRSIRSLSDKDLEKLGLTQDQLFELGATNLRKLLKPLSEAATPAAPGKLGQLATDFFETSRVALHDDWKPLVDAQGGVLLITLPAANYLLYASDDSPQAIDALRAAGRKVAQQSPAPLSSAVLRWTQQRWELVR